MIPSLRGLAEAESMMVYQPEKYFRFVAVATEFSVEVRYVSCAPDVMSQMLLSLKRGAIWGLDVAAALDASSTQSIGDRLRMMFSVTRGLKDSDVRSTLVVMGTHDWRKMCASRPLTV